MYAERNKERRELETFARLVEMCSGIARGVHRDNPEFLNKFAPRALAWLLGMATQLKINLERVVWDCYPGVCPHCRLAERCVCRLQPKRLPRMSPQEIQDSQKVHELPKNLLEWKAMFDRIYGPMNRIVGEAKCLASFQEELGELAEIIRFHLSPDSTVPKEEVDRRLREEFADMFAWYCGVCSFRNIEIDGAMKQIYQSICPECANNPCKCHPYHVHGKVRLGERT